MREGWRQWRFSITARRRWFSSTSRQQVRVRARERSSAAVVCGCRSEKRKGRVGYHNFLRDPFLGAHVKAMFRSRSNAAITSLMVAQRVCQRRCF
jgi:hypothetical protein